MCSLSAPLRLSTVCASLHLCVATAASICVCVCVCASMRLFKFISTYFGKRVLNLPPPLPPHPPLLPTPISSSLVCCPGCGSTMIALTIQQKKRKHLLTDCFPCSVMEMRFSISLHLQYLNTSFLRIGLSGLLTIFLPYKCCVVLQSLVEF